MVPLSISTSTWILFRLEVLSRHWLPLCRLRDWVFQLSKLVLRSTSQCIDSVSSSSYTSAWATQASPSVTLLLSGIAFKCEDTQSLQSLYLLFTGLLGSPSSSPSSTQSIIMNTTSFKLVTDLKADFFTLLLSAFVFCISTAVYLILKYRDGRAIGSSAPRSDLDIIPGVPILGNLLQVLRHGPRQLEFWSEMRRNQSEETKKAGKNLSLTVPGLRIIDCTKPEWIEYIQKTAFDKFGKGERMKKPVDQILGTGIFAVDGESWYHQRKASSKIFTGTNFRGVITHSIDNDIKKLQVILDRYATSGQAFDLSALFHRFTLDSFCQMAFGQDCGALSVDGDKPVPFAQAFDYAQSQLTNRLKNPLWELFERFNGQGKKMAEASKVIDDFAYNVIRQREKQGLGNIVDEKEVGTDLLSLYMGVRDNNGQPLTRKGLRDAVINLIIAGRDTTAQTLSWTFFHLLDQPENIAPLRAELDQCGKVDYDSYKTLTHSLAAFSEGLRLHPVVPKQGWVAKEDNQIPNGPFVKAGDLVRWSDWEMARMTDVWGPDASTYNPGRWIEEDGKTLKKFGQWKTHMFNGGPRLCLGQNLATFEGLVIMSAILKNFDVTFAPGYIENVEMVNVERTPRYGDSLTLPMKDPFMVTVSHRK